MNSACLFDIGVNFWETGSHVASRDLATLTLINGSQLEIRSDWAMVSAMLKDRMPAVLEWHTVGHALTKLQERKLLSGRIGPPDRPVYVAKNPESGIVSWVTSVHEDLHALDLERIAQPTHTVLVFETIKSNPSREQMWIDFSDADQGLSASSMSRVLIRRLGTVICRFLSAESHFAIQICGPRNMLAELLEVFISIGCSHIKYDGVSNYINRAEGASS